jgi:hypothetical protein
MRTRLPSCVAVSSSNFSTSPGLARRRNLRPRFQELRVAGRYSRNTSRNWLIGYARVSTYGQTLDSQHEQLRVA